MRFSAIAFTSLVFAITCSFAACKSSSSTSDACTICEPTPSVCNGHAELCSRTYEEVTFPGTHDAYANLANNFTAADQTYSLTRQLQDGVRVLHFELHPNLPLYDQAMLCHGLCAIGSESLVDGLTEVKTFLAANPTEVVTLLTEASTLTTDVVASAFDSTGTTPLTRTQTLGAPWPTLSQMIQSGQRIVVFYDDQTNTGGSVFPYFLDRFAFTWETPWDNEKLADFSRCNADRGTQGNSLYVVDTYLEDLTVETPADAMRVNPNPFLLDRVTNCQRTMSTRPNFVMVNFYEIGDLFHDVDVLNGFATDATDAGATPPQSFDGADAGSTSDAGNASDAGAD